MSKVKATGSYLRLPAGDYPFSVSHPQFGSSFKGVLRFMREGETITVPCDGCSIPAHPAPIPLEKGTLVTLVSRGCPEFSSVFRIAAARLDEARLRGDR